VAGEIGPQGGASSTIDTASPTAGIAAAARTAARCRTGRPDHHDAVRTPAASAEVSRLVKPPSSCQGAPPARDAAASASPATASSAIAAMT
jgi:hypothetical protein